MDALHRERASQIDFRQTRLASRVASLLFLLLACACAPVLAHARERAGWK